MREYKGMNEDNFLSSWLREDIKGTEERRKDMDKEAREKESRSGKREVEREKEETAVKRRCVNPFSSVFFKELDVWGFLGSCGVLGGGSGGSSVCELAGSSGEAGVCGVLVSPWAVSELGKVHFSVSYD